MRAPRRQDEPWLHREIGWSAEAAAHSETMLALSNGYLGIRGTLDEATPAALAGTYLAGCYESRPLPSVERSVGDPDDDQVLVEVADGTRIATFVGDEPPDIGTGTVLRHERVLDLRAGILVRTLRWRSPKGQEVALRTRRLVSLLYPEIAVVDAAKGSGPGLARVPRQAPGDPGRQPASCPRSTGRPRPIQSCRPPR